MNIDKMSEKELIERSAELDSILTSLFDEEHAIEVKLSQIIKDKILSSGMLQTITWKFIRYTSYSFKAKTQPYEPSELFNLTQMNHDDIYLNETCQLRFDDGELRLHFDINGLKYIKEWNLNVDLTNLEDSISSKEEELKQIREILNQIKP